MQSKGKAFFIVLVLALAGIFIAAMFHEPTLTQSTVEQALDAKSFEK